MRSHINLKGSGKERLGFVVFVTLIGSLVWLTHSNASKSTDALDGESKSNPMQAQRPGRPAPCPTCSSPKIKRVIYAPLFNLSEATGSEIVLNSRTPDGITITPTFYTLEGQPYVGDDIVLAPAEMRFVDTMSLIPEKERDRHKWGGMSFTYVGSLMERGPS
jgi:hypothetical protein